MALYETQNLKTDWKKAPKKKMLTFSCGLRREKCQFPRFPSFPFCSIPKIENSEISENFLLLKYLVVYETQNLKTDWKMTPKKKTLTFSCGLRRGKCQFPRFPSFPFCPIPKIENSKISESFLLLKFLVVYETQI